MKNGPKFYVGDEVVVTKESFHVEEVGWIGTVVIGVDGDRIAVDMSKYEPVYTRLFYHEFELRPLTKLERALK